MKALARKKKVSVSRNNAPWMNTFADLMNLLLCFFVLLFALSTVSEEKFEQVSQSMANSIGVFEGGGSAVNSGPMISSGVSQLNNLGDYFSSMGKNAEGNTDNKDIDNTKDGNGDNTSNQSTQDTTSNGEVGIKEALSKIQQEMETTTTDMYDKASDLADKYNLGDYVQLGMDPEYQYIQLTLKGSVLYESGSAELMENAKPILIKIGDILKKFDGYNIEITGHTDNVPMSSAAYKDNNWLSSARALNAAEFLITNSNLDPLKLKYSGRGEYEPATSNATAEGRAKNRRIEIKIYNEYSGG